MSREEKTPITLCSVVKFVPQCQESGGGAWGAAIAICVSFARGAWLDEANWADWLCRLAVEGMGVARVRRVVLAGQAKRAR